MLVVIHIADRAFALEVSSYEQLVAETNTILGAHAPQHVVFQYAWEDQMISVISNSTFQTFASLASAKAVKEELHAAQLDALDLRSQRGHHTSTSTNDDDTAAAHHATKTTANKVRPLNAGDVRAALYGMNAIQSKIHKRPPLSPERHRTIEETSCPAATSSSTADVVAQHRSARKAPPMSVRDAPKEEAVSSSTSSLGHHHAEFVLYVALSGGGLRIHMPKPPRTLLECKMAISESTRGDIPVSDLNLAYTPPGAGTFPVEVEDDDDLSVYLDAVLHSKDSREMPLHCVGFEDVKPKKVKIIAGLPKKERPRSAAAKGRAELD